MYVCIHTVRYRTTTIKIHHWFLWASLFVLGFLLPRQPGTVQNNHRELRTTPPLWQLEILPRGLHFATPSHRSIVPTGEIPT